MPTTSIQHKLVDDRYRIVSRIGQGAMGMVYKAEHVYTKRPVALKVIHSQFQKNDLYRVRFLREIELACRVHHPNAVQIFDAGQLESGMLYMAMEYLDGKTLSQLLRESPKGLDLQTVLHIAWQISQALDAVHHAGLVHRDLKPDNIMVMVDPDVPLDTCTAKILDFGIAHDVDTLHSLTGKGMIGTPKFMSPEQTRGENLTQKSDIYNLGLVVYAMLTGKEPFKSDSPVGYVFHHNMTTPPPVTSERSDISQSVEWAIQKALSKDPAERFDTAAEFMDALVGIGPHAFAAQKAKTKAREAMADRPAMASVSSRFNSLRRAGKKVLVFGALSLLILLGMSWLLPSNPQDAGNEAMASDAKVTEVQEIAESFQMARASQMSEPSQMNSASAFEALSPTSETPVPDVEGLKTHAVEDEMGNISAGSDTIFVRAVFVSENEDAGEETFDDVMAAMVNPPADVAPVHQAAYVATPQKKEEVDPNLLYYTNLRARHSIPREDAASDLNKPIEENSNIIRLREQQRLEQASMTQNSGLRYADARTATPAGSNKQQEAAPAKKSGPSPHSLPRVQGGVETLQSRIRIPESAYPVSGTVGVRLLIDESGQIEAEEIVQSVGYGYDEEVLRVLQAASFEPARVQNRPVKAWLNLKFRFQMNG